MMVGVCRQLTPMGWKSSVYEQSVEKLKVMGKLQAHGFVVCFFLRSLLYAALQANVIWAIAQSTGWVIDWIQVWWWLSAVHVIINSHASGTRVN
jgi:hypothetical protein